MASTSSRFSTTAGASRASVAVQTKRVQRLAHFTHGDGLTPDMFIAQYRPDLARRVRFKEQVLGLR